VRKTTAANSISVSVTDGSGTATLPGPPEMWAVDDPPLSGEDQSNKEGSDEVE
jgi:hypothetical protein